MRACFPILIFWPSGRTAALFYRICRSGLSGFDFCLCRPDSAPFFTSFTSSCFWLHFARSNFTNVLPASGFSAGRIQATINMRQGRRDQGPPHRARPTIGPTHMESPAGAQNRSRPSGGTNMNIKRVACGLCAAMMLAAVATGCGSSTSSAAEIGRAHV